MPSYLSGGKLLKSCKSMGILVQEKKKRKSFSIHFKNQSVQQKKNVGFKN